MAKHKSTKHNTTKRNPPATPAPVEPVETQQAANDAGDDAVGSDELVAGDQAEQTGPGRPSGSINKEYADVEEIPACCVKCGSTEMVRVPGSKEEIRRLEGTTRSGHPFNRVRWTRKRCSKCGQHHSVRAYYTTDEVEPAPVVNPHGVDIPYSQVVEGVLYRCWCEARQDYVAAELFTNSKGAKKWRIEGDIIARVDALIPKQRIEEKPKRRKN